VVAHALSAEDLGRWSLALAVQGYALHLGEFGLRGVVTTEAGRSGRRLPELLSRYLRLRLALSCLAIGLVVLGCAFALPTELLLVALVCTSILPIALQLDWLALVDDRNGLAAVLLLVRPLAFLALLGLMPSEPGAQSIATCFLAAWILAAIVSWISLDRPEAIDPGAVPVAATMLRRGRSLAIVTLTNQVQLSADLLLVGVALGTAAAGDYYLAGQILVAALLFANAAGQIALARLPALAGTPERFRAALAADMKRLLWFATVAALAIAAAAPVLAPRLFG
jgi:O-antigen/teichoic acid export membrane protein